MFYGLNLIDSQEWVALLNDVGSGFDSIGLPLNASGGEFRERDIGISNELTGFMVSHIREMSTIPYLCGSLVVPCTT